MLYPDMMLIDSHCHPNSDELRGNVQGLMNRAKEASVGRMLIVGCDLKDSTEAVKMSRDFKDYGAYAAVGLHPHAVKEYYAHDYIRLSLKDLAKELFCLFLDKRTVAVGEIGLDYHYEHDPQIQDAQKEIFAAQLEWAAQINKPVVLHIRDAMRDALDILKDFSRLKLLFHCYSGGLEYLDEVLSMGGLCAIGGAVTWKNSDELREVAKQIPIDRLLLETDCPYMTPEPFRGKTNEPAYVRYVYEKVAEIRGMEVKELADQIRLNADSFFGWGTENV